MSVIKIPYPSTRCDLTMRDLLAVGPEGNRSLRVAKMPRGTEEGLGAEITRGEEKSLSLVVYSEETVAEELVHQEKEGKVINEEEARVVKQEEALLAKEATRVVAHPETSKMRALTIDPLLKTDMVVVLVTTTMMIRRRIIIVPLEPDLNNNNSNPEGRPVVMEDSSSNKEDTETTMISSMRDLRDRDLAQGLLDSSISTKILPDIPPERADSEGVAAGHQVVVSEVEPLVVASEEVEAATEIIIEIEDLSISLC